MQCWCHYSLCGGCPAASPVTVGLVWRSRPLCWLCQWGRYLAPAWAHVSRTSLEEASAAQSTTVTVWRPGCQLMVLPEVRRAGGWAGESGFRQGSFCWQRGALHPNLLSEMWSSGLPWTLPSADEVPRTHPLSAPVASPSACVSYSFVEI